jgi:hypothetical protein
MRTMKIMPVALACTALTATASLQGCGSDPQQDVVTLRPGEMFEEGQVRVSFVEVVYGTGEVLDPDRNRISWAIEVENVGDDTLSPVPDPSWREHLPDSERMVWQDEMIADIESDVISDTGEQFRAPSGMRNRSLTDSLEPFEVLTIRYQYPIDRLGDGQEFTTLPSSVLVSPDGRRRAFQLHFTRDDIV